MDLEQILAKMRDDLAAGYIPQPYEGAPRRLMRVSCHRDCMPGKKMIRRRNQRLFENPDVLASLRVPYLDLPFVDTRVLHAPPTSRSESCSIGTVAESPSVSLKNGPLF